LSAGLTGIICGDSLVRAVRGFAFPYKEVREATCPSKAMLHLLAGRPLPGVEALRKYSPSVTQHPSRVVLPVDDSEDSLEVVLKAGFLLQSTGAEIHLL